MIRCVFCGYRAFYADDIESFRALDGQRGICVHCSDLLDDFTAAAESAGFADGLIAGAEGEQEHCETECCETCRHWAEDAPGSGDCVGWGIRTKATDRCEDDGHGWEPR